MCNLSQGIVEEAERDMEERLIISMYDNDINVEKIAVIVSKSVDEVQASLTATRRFLYRNNNVDNCLFGVFVTIQTSPGRFYARRLS
jgi:hypothetical protein